MHNSTTCNVSVILEFDIIPFCYSQKFLLKSLACLCPRQCRQDYQLCGQTGPSHKVMSPFLSIFFSTGYMGLLSGVSSTPSLLIKPLPLCLDWQLALSTMSGWERCLLWELECGVQCRQREHTWVSSFQWYNYNFSIQVLQGSCTSCAKFCDFHNNKLVCANFITLCYNYCVYSMYLHSEAPVAWHVLDIIYFFHEMFSKALHSPCSIGWL